MITRNKDHKQRKYLEFTLQLTVRITIREENIPIFNNSSENNKNSRLIIKNNTNTPESNFQKIEFSI